MAKETMIVFVYDTQMMQKEEDDPVSAILYFHPTWVSDQQKAALCGQIIGTMQCVKSIFTRPKIVSLQSGKFFITENGKYLLAFGTDRNVTDWLLKYRATSLYSIINFFHKDFESLAIIYKDKSLSAKLYHIFETYLKMIVFGGNIFSNVPSLALPKSASNVFLEAIHILQCCQEISHVLGGSILYHNKVVATQLSAHITKHLVLTDPYRIKCPAELAEVTFDLPLGVQLLQVYISNKEYSSLSDSSVKCKNICQNFTSKSIKKSFVKTSQSVQDTPIISAMKRDQSLLFTAVPEEGTDHTLPPAELPFIPTTKKIRPKFLNLKSLSIDSNIEIKPVKPAATTPFCGQTSVCSTPMTELKKFVHQNPLSICLSDDIELTEREELKNHVTEIEKFSISDNYEALFKKSVPYVNITSNLYDSRKHSSLVDIHDVVNSIAKDASQYFNVKSNGFVSLDLLPKKKRGSKVFKTITDPTFPVFKEDGTIVSYPYYNDFIKRNLELVQLEVKKTKGKETGMKNNFKKIAKSLKIETDTQKPHKNDLDIVSETDIRNKLPKVPINNKEHRKSLTLPLKSLNTDTVQTPIETVVNRRYSSGVQLTPLISKLSMLAFEERSSGFCSKDATPCDYRGLTPTQPNYSYPYSKFKTSKVTQNKTEDDKLQKCVLFICGQQDVVLAMLLKEECGEKSSTIKKLWEICTEHLGKLEKQLNYCMESQSGAGSHESEPYSYLCLDPEWDTMKRGGPWGTGDLGMLDYLHRDFNDVENLVEILVRGADSVIYGYHCGPSEVFYHESANINSGLPPPADQMGLVQLKAKRRLERDHAIILL